MKRSPAALLLLVAWTASLAALGLFVERRLDIGSDLRLFLPAPKTTEQSLLLDAIGEGPASRLLVVTLENARPEELAATSSALAESLRGNEQFRFVANGEVGVDSLPEKLLPYRYVLAADDSARALDRSRLRAGARGACTRSGLAGRLRSGAADRARSDLAAAHAARAMATRCRAAPRARCVVRRGGGARAARGRDACCRFRSGGTTRGPGGARRSVLHLAPRRGHDAGGERRRQLLRAHGSADARRGRKPRSVGDGRHASAAAHRVSPRRAL